MSKVFVPIFKKDENELFICTEDFIGETHYDAMKIGWGTSLVEGVLLKMEFTNEVREIDPKNTPHVKANIMNMPVAVISGPLFEERE